MKLRDILKHPSINPWFLGKNSKGSSVPLYSLLQFLSPYFKDSWDEDRYTSIYNIISSDKAKKSKSEESEMESIEYYPNHPLSEIDTSKRKVIVTAFKAIFNGENRVYPTMNFSSIFPHLGTLVRDNPSGKGMGKKILSLLIQFLDSSDPEIKKSVHSSLEYLFAPKKDRINDPITNFSSIVSGRQHGDINQDILREESEQIELSKIDKNLCQLIIKLIKKSTLKERTSIIKDLSYGIHLSICLHLLHYPLKNNVDTFVHGVLAYGGIPPGKLSNNYLEPAIYSLSYSIESGFKKSKEYFKTELENYSKENNFDTADALTVARSYFEYQNISDDEKWSAVESKITQRIFPSEKVDYNLLVEIIFDELGYSPSTIKANFIAWGKDIGFCGPQKASSKSGDGGQKPRLILDMPILNVLVNGLLDAPCGFDDFVALLADQLGIIVGPPRTDEQKAQLQKSLPNTFNTEDLENLLIQNKEELKQRLLRCGLARTFSDSETVIYPINLT